MSSLEDAVRDCLSRAVAAPPDPAIDPAENAIRHARRHRRRRQAASGLVAVAVVTALATGGVLAWPTPSPGPLRPPAGAAVDSAPFTMDTCGRALRCAY